MCTPQLSEAEFLTDSLLLSNNMHINSHLKSLQERNMNINLCVISILIFTQMYNYYFFTWLSFSSNNVAFWSVTWPTVNSAPFLLPVLVWSELRQCHSCSPWRSLPFVVWRKGWVSQACCSPSVHSFILQRSLPIVLTLWYLRGNLVWDEGRDHGLHFLLCVCLCVFCTWKSSVPCIPGIPLIRCSIKTTCVPRCRVYADQLRSLF